MTGARGNRRAAIGALVAAAVIVAVLVATHVGGGYELNAVFDQTHGLVDGADVRAAGLTVGKVTNIELGDDGLPHVHMRIDGDYRVRTGATADLRFFSVAGEINRYVMLYQGAGSELPGGATLGLARTDQPVEIDQVLSTLDPRTRANVHVLLAGLDSATHGRGADLDRTLRSSGAALGATAELVAQVDADGAALRTLVRSGRQVVGALARDPASITVAADRLASLLDTSAGRAAQLRATIQRLPGALRSPRLALDRLDASLGTLRALVRAAGPGIHELVPAARELRPALASARPVLREARALTRQAPAQLHAITPLLNTATPVLRKLDPVLHTANPILDRVRVRLPDFFSFFSNWADFTSDYDANGHAARVGIVFPPAPLNTIGPSSTAAGHLKAPFLRTPGVLEGEPWTDYQKSFAAGGGQP